MKLWLSCLLACLLIACGGQREPFKSTDITGAGFARDFSLIDHHGKPAKLADYRGKAVWLFFGYTHCPDVCPATLQQLGQAYARLGADAARVQVLMITLDPERDSAELLRQYVPAFHPSFIGLTGSRQQIDRTAAAFKVHAQKNAGEDPRFYTLDHTSSVFVYDPQGQPRLFYTPATPLDDLVADTRRLLEGE